MQVVLNKQPFRWVNKRGKLWVIYRHINEIAWRCLPCSGPKNYMLFYRSPLRYVSMEESGNANTKIPLIKRICVDPALCLERWMKRIGATRLYTRPAVPLDPCQPDSPLKQRKQTLCSRTERLTPHTLAKQLSPNVTLLLKNTAIITSVWLHGIWKDYLWACEI